ncbi:UNVERIFIED_CONTAM: hypothetical protein GTU68_066187 [Idotea baltica]|nr:hypothetical protein [Idotea baltica]
MKEVISLHVGQAGIQAGNASWELFCLEHGIESDGTMPDAKRNQLTDSYFTKFFKEGKTPGKFAPRSVFIDLDREAIDELAEGGFDELR